MIKYIAIIAMVLSSIACFAQKQTYDIIKYSAPKGWQKTVEANAVQFSKQNKNEVAMMMLFKSLPTEKDSKTNFDASWETIVKGLFDKVDAPQMQPAGNENGWTLESGAAVVEKTGTKAVANLISATGGGKMVNLLIIYNSESYQQDIDAFIASIVLPQVEANVASVQNNSSASNNSSLAGLWIDYNTEANGYSNGFPQLTGGYMRREYLLKSDGTYIFRTKDWMVYGSKYILFIYETGTYSISGSSITFLPKQGKGEWWNKTSRTNEWGSFAKASTDYKLEKKTYPFEIRAYSEPTLILKTGNTTGVLEYKYEKKDTNKSLIDNPPGFKLNEAASASENNILSNSANSILAGKTFEGTSLEKTGSGNMQFNTGGYWTWQYKFNKDGTYRFVYVAASHFNEAKLLQYETGTCSVNNDQLTIIPEKGANEEWSKIGKTSNGNSDAGNRAINDTWNKKLKTSSRKLEKVTYSFSIQYLDANKASTLILQHHNATERDGKPGWDDSNYYVESSSGKTGLSLPTGFQ